MNVWPSVNAATAMITSNRNELLRMMAACWYFFSPRRMAKIVLPPTPTIIDMAMMNRAMGKHIVMPPMPRLPTPCPTK